MTEERKPRSRLSRVMLILSVVVVSLVLLVVGGMFILVADSGIEAVVEGWYQVRPGFLAIKWATAILIIVRWRQIAHWLGDRLELADEEILRLEGLRWRVFGVLAVLELFIGQNLLGHILA